jgi:hypothetical protein
MCIKLDVHQAGKMTSQQVYSPASFQVSKTAIRQSGKTASKHVSGLAVQIVGK